MNVFEVHRKVIADYEKYIHSFITISDEKITNGVARIALSINYREPPARRRTAANITTYSIHQRTIGSKP
jgi:hypothetical protein